MRPAFVPSASELESAAHRALDRAYDARKTTNPGSSEDDFVAGYLAALSGLHV